MNAFINCASVRSRSAPTPTTSIRAASIAKLSAICASASKGMQASS